MTRKSGSSSPKSASKTKIEPEKRKSSTGSAKRASQTSAQKPLSPKMSTVEEGK